MRGPRGVRRLLYQCGTMKLIWRKALPVLLFLAATSILYVSFFSTTCQPYPNRLPLGQEDHGAEVQPSDEDNTLGGESQLAQSSPYHPLDCLINGDYTVGCRQEGQEVYVPFSFLQKYFEVFGKVKEEEGKPVQFEWSHSYSMVYPPAEKYTPGGEFMSFRHYNVEVRERVKCISGVEGVPISTQWGSQGYYYPIQIAQYGLSHYSKHLAAGGVRAMEVVEDAEEDDGGQGDEDGGGWSRPHGDVAAELQRVFDKESHSYIYSFHTSKQVGNSQNNGITLSVPSTTTKSLLTLSLDVFWSSPNGSIAVLVELKGKQPSPRYTVVYSLSTSLIQVAGDVIYYGIGERGSWTRLTRDLSIDVQKGLALTKTKSKAAKIWLNRVISITFYGTGGVDNVTLSGSAHLAQFYYAANWLVLQQDEQGGWPILVTRKLAAGLLEMPPGWYSAMAQGQAMSLLVRAYLRTHNNKYLNAALRATRLFDVPSSDGGVLAKFAGQFKWYEEYPTTPSVFVLNGFIYSLIGLYDLKSVVNEQDGREASRLYSTGMESLKRLLPLFDTGSGTMYDLRHFALGSAPNLARWDYHTTHINQLLLLATIDKDPLFSDTAQRWIGYMKGKRAPHN